MPAGRPRLLALQLHYFRMHIYSDCQVYWWTLLMWLHILHELLSSMLGREPGAA